MNRAPLTRTLTDRIVFTERVVDIVAVPFDQVINIGGGQREAFPTDVRVEPLRNPVPALLHHDDERPFGHVELMGRTQDGILARMHAARTAAGDEALELAAAGVLFPSIGFTSTEDRQDRGVTWRDSIVLWEISLVTFPAYAGGATITEVREAVGVTDSRQKPGLALVGQILRDARRKDQQ